jgi:hypothetical protein
MSFIGKGITRNLLILVWIAGCSSAENSNQFIGGQLPDEYVETTKSAPESVYFPSEKPGEFQTIGKAEGQSSFLAGDGQGEMTEPGLLSQVKGFGVEVVGSGESLAELSSNSDRALFNRVAWAGESAFSFSYFRNDFSYRDPSNIYEKTFRQSTGSIDGGSLLFSLDKYLWRGFADLYWQTNLGFGFNSGKGYFVTGEESDTRMSLWTLPLDLGLGIGLPLGRFARLTASGGPSAMGLYQSRSDRNSGEEDKYRRQIGTGYYANAKLQLSLSNAFIGSFFEFFRTYRVTNAFLNFEARTQSYANFQDDIEIDGTSLGLGFSFDFI